MATASLLSQQSIGAAAGPRRPPGARSALTRRAALPTDRACHQEESPSMDRRAILGTLAAAAPLVGVAAPSWAAYGQSANVFGRTTNRSGFIPFIGDGFSLALPSKWNPSPEREFPNVVLRYQDNFDYANHLEVLAQPAPGKSDITAFGSPDDFLRQVQYLLGQQAFDGETVSEGGFAPNRIAAASVLDEAEVQDKAGKTFYTYEILVRTADGDEGGRHVLIKAVVSQGQLFILKVVAGDKRWFKGTDKDCLGVLNSFTVA